MTVVPLLPPRRSTARATPAPAELGRELDAEQIRAEFFPRLSRDWVLKNVAPDKKWYMGKTAVWYEAHVKEWKATWVAEQQQRGPRKRSSDQ